MNNYNDYYNYLNGYSDMNFMPNPNNMIDDMNYQNAFPNTFMQNNNSVADSMTGLKRGNMFNNLYEQYKNYKPEELKAKTEREDLLLQIKEQKFAMIDLGLYLDLHPNDKSVLNLFNNSLNKEKELCNLYESKYGPLTFDSMAQNNDWLWVRSPWPWEVQK